MADIVDKETRSRMMRAIGPKDTKPELIVRCALHALGFRYRLHVKALPGKPDIVLPKYGAIINVNGCYWHRHEGCTKATVPLTNTNKWMRKFEANVERDARNRGKLLSGGWRIANVWECSLKANEVEVVIKELSEWLLGNDHNIEIPCRNIL